MVLSFIFKWIKTSSLILLEWLPYSLFLCYFNLLFVGSFIIKFSSQAWEVSSLFFRMWLKIKNPPQHTYTQDIFNKFKVYLLSYIIKVQSWHDGFMNSSETCSLSSSLIYYFLEVCLSTSLYPYFRQQDERVKKYGWRSQEV